MKKTKIIIPAMGMLLLGTAASVTGTVAWFSMNNKVSITGMQVKTAVGDNILIAGDTLESTSRQPDSNFSNSLEQEAKGYLGAVSTVDGKVFYYVATDNAKASGDAINEAYIPYDNYSGTEEAYGLQAATNATAYGNKFSENYGISKTMVEDFTSTAGPALAFVDYVFQLKAINTSTSAAKNINLSKLDLIYNGAGSESNAYRVAFFVEDITSAAPVGTGIIDNATRNGIYTEADAANFTAGNAVNSKTTLGSVSYISSATAVASVPTSSTKYFKVVARLWLEGEDNTCNNETFLALTSDWSLNIDMVLEEGTTSAVTNIKEISSINAASYSATADGKVTVETVDYNLVTGLKYNGKQVYTKTAPGALTTSSQLYTYTDTPSPAVTEVTDFFILA